MIYVEKLNFYIITMIKWVIILQLLLHKIKKLKINVK